MKRMRYSEIDRKIAELEEVLSDGTVTWRDRRGKHAGTWRAFGEAVFSCLPERRGDVSREDCPLIAFTWTSCCSYQKRSSWDLEHFLIG